MNSISKPIQELTPQGAAVALYVLQEVASGNISAAAAERFGDPNEFAAGSTMPGDYLVSRAGAIYINPDAIKDELLAVHTMTIMESN